MSHGGRSRKPSRETGATCYHQNERCKPTRRKRGEREATLRLMTFGSTVLITVLGVATACAQGYPSRAIRVIVPFPPGGGNDVLGRIVCQKLSEQLRQQLVMDNRGGAGGIVGVEMAARAAPDGYTLLIGGNGPIAIVPNAYAKVPYDPVRDFAPISLFAIAPSVLVTPWSLPAKSVQDLIALAKARPGQLNFGSGGTGTPPHLAGELFRIMADIDVVHVPYKGVPAGLIDVVAGRVQFFFSSIPSGLPLVRDRKVKALAVTSLKRSAIVPDMPTIAEKGVPGYESVNWYSILAPAGTPPAIIARLHADTVKAIGAPEMRKRLLELGAEGVTNSPAELALYVRSEVAKWGKVIRAAGIKME